MKKVVMTVVGVLALAASANAQTTSNAYGTWYTDQALWESLVTNVRTADYNSGTDGLSVLENGVTATASNSNNLGLNGGNLFGGYHSQHITYTFSGNAFSTQSFVVDGSNYVGSIDFIVDGSASNTYNLPTTTSAGSFLGYISNSSSSIINVRLTPTPNMNLGVKSFSAGQSVAPEPGTLALALTGGCALIGMYIRRRRMLN
jgi:hypothetical protein